VFDVMAATGSGNARAMASGVSKATIPTMAGMVASISGLYFSTALDRRSRREVQKVADELVID
jgi:biopolymer transport protein ExbB